ncbi:MAG: ABC transporter ATP-binding protein [Desulfobacterales bacterium]|nr:ABC transporter ATP-binding protein [Desulfobacterales bacterium]
MENILLDINELSVSFDAGEGRFTAVNHVCLHIQQGETVGLVGESGSGKSVTALSILRLIPSPNGKIERGSIRFKDQNILNLPIEQMQKIRGKQISMIFQDPISALSPLQPIWKQLLEMIEIHQVMSKKEAIPFIQSWLKKVGIADPETRMYAYPYQLSGGMQQRVMIAMALMLDPDLILADEPTTALDVTIQAQVFELIRQIKSTQTAMLLITHDMGVVWDMCDRIMVMYASEIVEQGSRDDIFFRPRHPYTQGLLDSIPKLNKRERRLKTIDGQVLSPFQFSKTACHFRDRCKFAFDRCHHEKPLMVQVEHGHDAACFFI